MGPRSFGAPSGVAPRPASLWRWGTEWLGRAAKTPRTAAPTRTALMERQYPFCSSPPYRSYYCTHFLFPICSKLQICLPYHSPGAWEPVQWLPGWTGSSSDCRTTDISNTPHGYGSSNSFPLVNLLNFYPLMMLHSSFRWNHYRWTYPIDASYQGANDKQWQQNVGKQIIEDRNFKREFKLFLII